MKKTKTQFSKSFKAKVAIEAIKNVKSISELSALYEVSPRQIYRWKKELEENASSIFDIKAKEGSGDKVLTSLYEQIGKLQVQNEWLKKKL